MSAASLLGYHTLWMPADPWQETRDYPAKQMSVVSAPVAWLTSSEPGVYGLARLPNSKRRGIHIIRLS